MMKSLFTQSLALISLWLVAECISANPITEAEALKRANQFMPNKHFSARKYSPRFASCQAAPPFYIFNADDGGFVLVSGDDRTMPILGYSEHDQLDLSQAPENLLYWLDCYAQQIENLDNGYRAVTIGASLTDAAAISPLIQTKWDQYGPYNAQCPYWPGSSERCLTGCVATCMAQIMYYYKWPEHCPAIPAYTPDGFSQPLDELPPVDFRWDDMQLTYGYNEEGSAADAVAQLMRYCGQSVEMNYGLDGSGAPLKVGVMINTFDYSENTKRLIREFYSEAEWENIIYQELAKGHPVPYEGYPDDGNPGHQFICDGYDNRGYFHINWGWGGQCDAYYVLSVANPYTDGSSGYSQDQRAIIGLEPKAIPSDYAVNSFTVSEDVLLGEKTDVWVSLTNLGNTSRERLVLWMKQDDSWTMIASVTGTIAAGQTGEIVMTFVPSTDGIFEMKLTSDPDGDVVKASSTIHVVEPVEKVAGNLVYLCNSVSRHAFVKGPNQGTSIYTCVIPETFDADGVTYTVVAVCEKAFYMEFNVHQLELPSSLTKIGAEAFMDCRNLEMVVSHIKHPFYIQDNTFVTLKWNNDIRAYDVAEPTAVLYVPEGSKPEYEAIPGWTHFAKVSEGKPQEVFAGNLKYLCLPDPNTAYVIRDESYKGLTEVNIPEQVEYGGATYSVVRIEKDAFKSCVFETVTLPTTLKSIGDYAFWNCYKLKEVIIPEGCESIGHLSFTFCHKLRKLVLPASLTYLGSQTFGCNQSLGTVVSHSTTPCTVNEYVFTLPTRNEETQSLDNLPSPATLYVPVGTKDEYIAKGWDQFAKISEGEPEEAVIEGLRYLLLTTEKTAVVLPDENYSSLTELIIPERVEYKGAYCSVAGIANDAFSSCLRIASLSLPSTLESIGENAFWNCRSLTEVIIPEGCETISSSAFDYCFNLQKVVLPAKLAKLGDYAFRDISSLISVVSPCNSPCRIDGKVFAISSWNRETQSYEYKPSPATLYVPVGSKADYIANGWDQFAAIVEDDESSIGSVIDDCHQTDDDVFYNQFGQRVTNPQKGIYIQNGKKVLIR